MATLAGRAGLAVRSRSGAIHGHGRARPQVRRPTRFPPRPSPGPRRREAPAGPRQLRARHRGGGRPGGNHRAPVPAHDRAGDQPRGAADRGRMRLSRPAAGGAVANIAGSHCVPRPSAVRLFVARTAAWIPTCPSTSPSHDRRDLPASRWHPARYRICRRARRHARARTGRRLPGRSFRAATVGRRTALPRHRTLRATLDWSYELLPEAERRLCCGAWPFSPAASRSRRRGLRVTAPSRLSRKTS